MANQPTMRTTAHDGKRSFDQGIAPIMACRGYDDPVMKVTYRSSIKRLRSVPKSKPSLTSLKMMTQKPDTHENAYLNRTQGVRVALHLNQPRDNELVHDGIGFQRGQSTIVRK